MTTWRSRLHDDEALGLVEMLVSVMLIGIVLSALAASLLTSLRAIRGNESQVKATALHQELLEGDVALPWEMIGVYADDPDYVGTIVEDGDTFDMVTLPATSPPDPRVEPRIQVINTGGREYTVIRDIYWVDTDGDGMTEAKRLRTTISWTEAGRTSSSVFHALRLPTTDEIEDAFEVLLFEPSPNVVQLDAGGYTASNVTFVVNTSTASFAPTVSYTRADGTTGTVSTWTSNADGTSWTATLYAGAGPMAAGDQLVTLQSNSTGTPSESRSAAVTMTFLAAGTPPVDSNFEIKAFTANPNPGQVDNQRDLCPITYTVRVRGFTNLDQVAIQYEYWVASGNGSNATLTKTQSSRVAATHVLQEGENATFKLTRTPVAGEDYVAGQKITMTAIATRQNSTVSRTATFDLPLVSVGGNCG